MYDVCHKKIENIVSQRDELWKSVLRLRFGDHHMQLNFVKGLCKRFVRSIGNLMKRMINGCAYV